MRSNTHSENRNGRLRPFKAAVAGLAVLCAAALAVAGAAGGAAPVSALGRTPAPGPQAGAGVAGGGRGLAALPPIRRLCFHGPRGEPVDFPAVLDCP